MDKQGDALEIVTEGDAPGIGLGPCRTEGLLGQLVLDDPPADIARAPTVDVIVDGSLNMADDQATAQVDAERRLA